jgi:hypothetical protein
MKQVVNKTVNLSLVGVDGNAYAILATFTRQAKKENWSQQEIELVMEEAQSKDYDHLLNTILNHCQEQE